MTIRSPVFWFVAVIVVFTTLMLWHGKKRPLETPPMAPVEANTTPPTATAPSQPVRTPVHANTPPAGPVANAVKVSLPSQAERAIGILSTYNDVPINFYGRLEDQSSNAVAGAAVNFSVRIMNGREFTAEHGQTVSDAGGFFTISGYTDQSLA